MTPAHDFHTSWMNMTYIEKNKEFEVTWRTDTEHLEGVLTAYSGQDIHLENNTIEQHISRIESYIKDNTDLRFNKNHMSLSISIIESTFAETIVHFEPIKCRGKLKNVAMNNTLLLAQFPNQKNMLQINYKGEMYSMLFSKNKPSNNVIIQQKR
ncbi:MAG: DUF6702 family protein [Bacteroidia bacterium]